MVLYTHMTFIITKIIMVGQIRPLKNTTGVAWGTKGNGALPAPNDHNRQSFDGLYKFTNGVEGQLAVAEASPGNTAYNGGRWIEYSVTFNGEPELVTSYAQLQTLDVTIVETGNYFQCPLLPVKQHRTNNLSDSGCPANHKPNPEFDLFPEVVEKGKPPE